MDAKRAIPGSRIVWIVASVLAGVVPAAVAPSLSHGLAMGGLLLFAWGLAYAPGPSSKQPLSGIYGDFRRGLHRADATAGLVQLAALALMLASFLVDR